MIAGRQGVTAVVRPARAAAAAGPARTDERAAGGARATRRRRAAGAQPARPPATPARPSSPANGTRYCCPAGSAWAAPTASPSRAATWPPTCAGRASSSPGPTAAGWPGTTTCAATGARGWCPAHGPIRRSACDGPARPDPASLNRRRFTVPGPPDAGLPVRGRRRFPGSIRCPYHAWTYALDGTLRAAPFLPALREHRAALSLHRGGRGHLGRVRVRPARAAVRPGPAEPLGAALGRDPRPGGRLPAGQPAHRGPAALRRGRQLEGHPGELQRVLPLRPGPPGAVRAGAGLPPRRR